MELRLLEDPTRDLINKVKAIEDRLHDDFEIAQEIMPLLGMRERNGYAEVGFWAPELLDQGIPLDAVVLEVLRPADNIDLRAPEQTVQFQRVTVPLRQHGVYLFGVISGMRAGTREQVGDFYQVIYTDQDGQQEIIPDYLAASIPFGVFAPVEYYDINQMHSNRADRDHFGRLDFEPAHQQDGIDRIGPPTNILQIHVRYASPEGTLAGLTTLYRRIAGKLRAEEPLTPAEQNYIGYDAVQLMPIEPIIEYETEKRNFWVPQTDDPDSVAIQLRKPDMTNWGYDVMITASPAVNPALLGTGRPDELVDFIAELHNFPTGPIKVMLDIVYGHIDNQAVPLLNEYFFAGANMYGQNVDFTHPVTRALLLEMMRRKHNYGIDGIRVDGAQDFKNYDSKRNEMIHDDDYLRLMNDITLEVAGRKYRPWMIFEDGRPWPRPDWELASSYREITKQMPNVWQWGPLTFAHNTPFLFTFWMMKWWRVREMAEVGREWITGCSNHDTLRRGSQTPTDARVNTYQGTSLVEIFNNAYDNLAAKLFDYVMMPGVPMDFINASMRAPWGFIRNTDDRYGVKVVSEEARFSEWLMTEDRYGRPDLFPRLKSFGFETLKGLRNFMHVLDHAVLATGYDLDGVVRILNSDVTPEFVIGDEIDVPRLKAIARAWMNDVHEFCNVSNFWELVEPERATYKLAVRQFRQARPWLMDNLRDDEYLNYLHPTEGCVIYYGLRRSPDDSEMFLFVANMEGEPKQIVPAELPVPGLPRDAWEAYLWTPYLEQPAFDTAMTLADSQAVVFRRDGS